MLGGTAQHLAQPLAIGVQRPAYGDGMEDQLRRAAEQQGPGDLSKLLSSGDTWEVTV